MVQAFLIDQLNLCVADFIIGARPVLGGGGRGSVGTANGGLSKVVKGRRYFVGIPGRWQANSGGPKRKPSKARHFGHARKCWSRPQMPKQGSEADIERGRLFRKRTP